MQNIVIRYKALNQEKASYFECKITSQTKVSSLRAAIRSHFSIDPSEQALIYDPDSENVPSSKHKLIQNHDLIAKIVPPGGTIHVIKKSSYLVSLPQSLAASGSASIAYFNKLGIIGSTASPKSSIGPDSVRGSFFANTDATNLLLKHIKSGNFIEFNKEAQRLVGQKVNLNNPIAGGWTFLHYAGYMGHTQIVNTLLQAYKVIPNKLSIDDWTPLHLACSQGHLSTVKALVTVGNVDVNLLAGEHGTPLHCAARAGKVQIVSYLLLHKADTEIADTEGKKPIDISTSDKITTMLIRQKKNTLTKEKSAKMGKELMKELHLKSSVEYKGLHVPPKPPRVTGYTFKIGKVLGRKNRRYFEMNPIEGTLIKYMRKEDYPKNPKEIYCIADVIGLTRLPSVAGQKFHFFELADTKRKHKFCFGSEKAANLWFQYINCAIPYCKFLKNLSSSAYEQNLSSELRDTNSELLENILKEPQEEVEIEDLPPPPIAEPTLKKIEEKKEEEEDRREYSQSVRVTGKTLMKELEENKEVFTDQVIEQGKKICFSSFKILEKIGAGAFGQIFKVQLAETGAIYAMKSISKDYLFKTKQLKYALSECKILKSVDYPFVIKMHYAFQTPKYLHFILDYCEGGDLSMHINNRQIFEETEAKFYIAELILAIEYLHSKNIIYRDLKPDNVLLGIFLWSFIIWTIARDGHVKLSDFGLAKQIYGQDPPTVLSFCGSPAYLSPEMLFKKGTNKPLDVYGIGTILYELLVGLPPYYDDDMKTMYRNIAYGKLKVPRYVSIEARNVLKKVLERNPEKRISLFELKKEEFFEGIDWEKLAKRQVKPPIDVTDFHIDYKDECEEVEEAKTGYKENMFIDEDYTEGNMGDNRFPNITFTAANNS